MTETGTVQVEHHQFLLAATDTDTTAVTGEGNLWAALGFVTVLTGIAHGPATLTLDSTDEADTATEDWEVVEETVIDSPEPLRVIGLDEHVPPQFAPSHPDGGACGSTPAAVTPTPIWTSPNPPRRT
ncbi:hypothetical protein [Nocardia farcinica]|uniref:hypothetical protein n=1 Tax=Nocardia farcinica TaxID=37329 RepID=UPI0024583038|nr:hypothetical protein [Nocardia farcinica]